MCNVELCNSMAKMIINCKYDLWIWKYEIWLVKKPVPIYFHEINKRNTSTKNNILTLIELFPRRYLFFRDNSWEKRLVYRTYERIHISYINVINFDEKMVSFFTRHFHNDPEKHKQVFLGNICNVNLNLIS
jgi:hypothetical protein